MRKFLRKYFWLIIGSLLIICLDQLTKWLVVKNIPYGGVWSPWEWLTPVARIVHWSNTGVAFGMLQGMNPVFIALALIVSGMIIYYYQQIDQQDWLIRLALTLELGGALGNMIDRIRYGHVVDMISVGNFPVFNIADSCITIGVVILLLGVWLQEKREKTRQIHAEASDSIVENKN
ncbi:MAG TPA: signal peptidase II [Anaerolineaceae bacterium]|nr:signal peptidase II [Anaerolineaceae bacterium]